MIPSRTQSQDKKFSSQSTTWNTKVRSGHNISCLCSFLVELSGCLVTYENCRKSSIFLSNLRRVDGFKKFQRFWVKELSLYNRIEAFFRKFSSEVEKCIMWSSIQVLPNQVSKKSFYTFEDIDLRESHAKLHKKAEWNSGSRLNLKRLKSDLLNPKFGSQKSALLWL